MKLKLLIYKGESEPIRRLIITGIAILAVVAAVLIAAQCV